jgi:hypothetical protein
LFSVYNIWVANVFASNGGVARDLAAQFLALAERQGATVPLMIGFLPDGHLEPALSLYDPNEHRPLATRFRQDVAVNTLTNRSAVLWMLGYPDAAVRDADEAVKYAREIGHAATLLYALTYTPISTYIWCGNYTTAEAIVEEGDWRIS